MQTKRYETLVDKHREEILAAEDYIWRHPETGFREWKTTAYMQDVFEKAGYTLVKAGDIPGFYTDIETGRPGPKLLIMAELDALSAPNHVQAVDGCAHACGHHAQCAAMAGIALALKEPGALDGLSGSVRLMCVPAEELIELDFRDGLRRAGVIHYLGGKTEFMLARSGICVDRFRLFRRLIVCQRRIALHEDVDPVFIKFFLRFIRSERGAELERDAVSFCRGDHIAHRLGTAAVHHITALNFFKRYVLDISFGNRMRRIDKYQSFEIVILYLDGIGRRCCRLDQRIGRRFCRFGHGLGRRFLLARGFVYCGGIVKITRIRLFLMIARGERGDRQYRCKDSGSYFKFHIKYFLRNIGSYFSLYLQYITF